MPFFWTSQNSIFLAQMGGNIVEEGIENVFWTSMYNLLSNLEEEAL
jgi:hypothetical protein